MNCSVLTDGRPASLTITVAGLCGTGQEAESRECDKLPNIKFINRQSKKN